MTWPRCNHAPRGKLVLLEACIIGASFYQISKPSINVGTRICVWSHNQQNLANSICVFWTKAQMQVAFVYTKNSVVLQIQSVDLLKFHEIYWNNNIDS